MRLTRETLLKIARDTAAQRVKISRRIICIYLTGSVLSEAPLLGGTTDIDLFIVHDSDPIQPREVVRLTDEVHLDIAHFSQARFHQPRHLRTDSWLGPFIYSKPLVLHDTQHWFDYTQASTGAQFFQPDYVIQRAGKLAQKARQGWMELELSPSENHPGRVSQYLKSVENAGNALASLAGDPLSERRFLLWLPQRIQALQQPDLLPGLIQLINPSPEGLEAAWPEWLTAWKQAFQQASQLEEAPPRLKPCRQMYYERAMAALWEENPTAALWLMLKTWSQALSILPSDAPAQAAWQTACTRLQMDEEHFTTRLQELDRFLDRMEETLEAWGQSNGATALPEINP